MCNYSFVLKATTCRSFPCLTAELFGRSSSASPPQVGAAVEAKYGSSYFEMMRLEMSDVRTDTGERVHSFNHDDLPIVSVPDSTQWLPTSTTSRPC